MASPRRDRIRRIADRGRPAGFWNPAGGLERSTIVRRSVTDGRRTDDVKIGP
jgi:hypothetical protein